MSRYSEVLNIDIESLMTLSDVYFGYAGTLIKTEDRRYYPYIASCFTIAAIFKSIIEPGSGTESFRRAAEYYAYEGNSYWVVCSTCAYDLDKVSEFFNQNEGNFELSSDLLENILASSIINEAINEGFYFYNLSAPIGRLNIPAKIYVDALKDVPKVNISTYEKRHSFNNILSFLKRSTENVYFLRGDSFHWQNLYGNFIPIEPEILALCIVICKQFRELDISISQVFEQAEIDAIAKLPLQIADEICSLHGSKQ